MPDCQGRPRDWEIRSSFSDGPIAHVLFCTCAGRLVLLHGFIMKSQKTPAADIAVAVERVKALECCDD